MLSKTYNVTLGNGSKLGESVSALAGHIPEQTNIDDLLGKPVLLTAVHARKADGTISAKIKSVTAVPRGMSVPAAKMPLLSYDIENPDSAIYEQLPEWVKWIISYAQIPEPVEKEEEEKETGIHAGLVTEKIPF